MGTVAIVFFYDLMNPLDPLHELLGGPGARPG